MSNRNEVGAGVSANAASDWVVFTGKLPQELRKKLKMISAETGRKQQEILAEALGEWIEVKGL